MYIDRIDISLIYRPFLNRSVQLMIQCAAAGSMYVATSGTRTHEQQNALYAQGRTTPGKIVTNAKGGQSLHNFGIAIDFTLDRDVVAPGLQPSWAEPDYYTLRDEATKIGLESGLTWAHFKDAPHIQLPISKHGITLAQLEAKYQSGGMHEVFHFLDGFAW